MALPLLLAHAPQTPSSLLPSLTLRRCRHLDAHGILTVVVILVVVAVGYKIWRQRQVNRRAMLSDPQQVLIYEHLKEREAAEKAEKKKNGGPWWAFKRSSPASVLGQGVCADIFGIMIKLESKRILTSAH